MQSTLLILAIAGAVCAAPPMVKPTHIADNHCGQPFGKCYEPLGIVARADAPTPTAPPKAKPTTTKDDCHTRTVCIDGINKCGIPWGVCIPDCKPWKYQTPECPSPTPSAEQRFMTAWKRTVDDEHLTIWAKREPTTTSEDGVMTIWNEKPLPTTSEDGVMTIWNEKPLPTTSEDGVMTIWNEKPLLTTSEDGVMTIWDAPKPTN
ncbi:hypothetical protein CDD81_6035 [Ophiocordyceps australis]|uniref:Uncharacterized protein n=1 Tax=Ophiocordyceps australis TaxID=1399860 RepID=A0A2C5XI01_9HYPO|nr:hypothetical protein CDD81_6035 [Ophiocordyceps australis]